MRFTAPANEHVAVIPVFVFPSSVSPLHVVRSSSISSRLVRGTAHFLCRLDDKDKPLGPLSKVSG